MILSAISYFDCVVFLIFLAPQLIYNVGFIETAVCALRCLPFLLIKLPISFTYTHLLLPRSWQSAFTASPTTSLFQDFVIRIVRFAFENLPSHIGRVFFSKNVALPFLRWRMLRHGHLTSDVPWRVVEKERGEGKVKGVWIGGDGSGEVDLVVYYVHGGGFAMGSPYFYLEFLLTLCTTLRSAGYQNPAIFALEYTLVPDAHYPVQLNETYRGYQYLVDYTPTNCKIVVAGDSAGGTLVLSLLLHLSRPSAVAVQPTIGTVLRRPDYCILISPWTTLISPKNRDTASDYLNADQLRHYASLYAASANGVYVSPGLCKDAVWWAGAIPEEGICCVYGSEEVFAAEIREFAKMVRATVDESENIHAWPVAIYFLGSGREEREGGLRTMVRHIRGAMMPAIRKKL